MRARLQALVRAHPILGTVDPDLLAKRGTHLSLAADELLYAAGQEADAVYFIVGGALQIEYPERRQKRGRAIAIVMAPGVLGECQTLYRRPWTGSGVALTPLDAYALERHELFDLLEQAPRAATLLYCELAWQFLGAIERRRAEPYTKPEERLRDYMIDRARIAAELDPRFAGWLPMTHSDLARACALRRETVARILAGWRKSGRVETGRGRLRLTGARPRAQRHSLIARMNDLAETRALVADQNAAPRHLSR